jgi:hypothetical protein
MARYVMEREGKERKDKLIQGNESEGMKRKGKERKVMAWKGIF